MRKPTYFLVAGTLSPLLITPLLLVGLAGTSLPLLAQTGTPIGRIILVKGQVAARDSNGNTRVLTRKSNVFEADTVIVGADAYVQIKMVDAAMLALQANTEFAFNTYEFDGNRATPDTAIMSMVRGGFRTISGTVGDEDADAYRIDTPYASIGIRGTVHSGVIESGVLFTGVYEGGTTISNNEGTIDAGFGADYDFTETRAGLAPLGLIEAPPALAQLNLTLLASQDEPVVPGPTPATNVAGAPNNGNDAPTTGPQTSLPDFAVLAATTTPAATNNIQATVVTVTGALNTSAEPANARATISDNGTTNSAADAVNPALFYRNIGELATNTNGASSHNSSSSNSKDDRVNSPGALTGSGSTGTTSDPSNSNSANGNSSIVDRGNSAIDNGNTGGSSTTTGRGNSASSSGNSSSTTTTDRGNASTDSANGNPTTGRGNSGASNESSPASSDRGNSGTSNGNLNTGSSGNSSSGNSTTDRGNSGTGNATGDVNGNTTDRGNSGSSTSNGSASGSSTDRGNASSTAGNSNAGNTNTDRGNSSSESGNATSSKGNSSSTGSNTSDAGSTTDRGNSASDNGNPTRSNGNSSSSGSSTSDSGTTTDRGNSSTSNGGSSQTGNSSASNDSSSGANSNTGTTRSLAARQNAEYLARPTLDPMALLRGWGMWDSSLLVVLENPRALLPGLLTDEGGKVGLRLASIAHLAGSVTYQNAQFAGIDESGAPLLDVDMSFDVNLLGGHGAVSNGRLLVIDSGNDIWRIAFQGNVAASSASMSNITGSFGTGAPVSGSVQGVFTGTDALPDFFSGFILESGTSFVKGLTVLNPTCGACE